MNATAHLPRHTPKLSLEAVLVLGLAGTSMPFSDSPEAEVDRWLRVLRLHGRTGRVLQAVGVGETPLEPSDTHERKGGRAGDHVVGLVTRAAVDAAAARDAATVETADILSAVLRVYGPYFEEALEAHGTTVDEVLERMTITPTD